MGSLKQLIHIIRFESLRRIVSWRFPIAMVAAVVVLVLAYTNGMSSMNEGHSSNPAYDLLRPFVASSTLVLAISAVIMSSESLSDEFEKRSGFMMFTRSMSRNTFYAGKFLSGFLVSMIILIVYYAVTFSICINEVGYLPTGNVTGFLLAILYLFSATAACMVFSAVSPRSSMSMIISFALLAVVPIFMQNVTFDSEPWYSLGYAAGAVGDVALGNSTVYSIIDGELTVERFFPDAMTSSLTMGTYGVISTMISALIFRYRTW